MESPKDTNGKQENQGTNNYALAQSQYIRLGYFLTASAFLVVAFITLVVAEKNISVWLTHLVALLGSSIAAGYTFMNWWLSKGKDIQGKDMQLLHTWGIPLIFFYFG